MSLQASQLLRNLQSMPFSGSETSSNVDELSGKRVVSGLCMGCSVIFSTQSALSNWDGMKFGSMRDDDGKNEAFVPTPDHDRRKPSSLPVTNSQFEERRIRYTTT
jgi:hypothetical protein